MCGFAGILGIGACEENTLYRMAAALRHRGPDDKGIWMDPGAGVGLAHVRLSVLDLSLAGHQPMVSPSGRYVVALNGEIYNHLYLRTEMEKAGQAPNWRGHSDTETLLAGFDAWGIEKMVNKSVGMFALALWDRHTRILTLGRDRLGEKPLYYGWQGETFILCSELKALKALPAFRPEIDRNALASFFRFGYIPAPKSIYRGIYKLRAGTLLTVRADHRADAVPVPFWSLLDVARHGVQSPFAGTDVEALDVLEATLSEAVSIQQISDVPLGSFLSGGIDSSTIVALMQAQSKRPVHTFTIGFAEQQYNEAAHARAVAQHLGTHHTELYVRPEEAREVIPRLPELYDEPFADSSQIPTFLVSQLARHSVTVSLSGDAGDELFGGYNRYVWTRKVQKIPPPLRRIFARGLRALSASQWDRFYTALEPVLPKSVQARMPGDKAHKIANVLDADSDAAIYLCLVSTWPEPNDLVLGGQDQTDFFQRWDELGFASLEQRMMLLDTLTYLPDDILCKVDRAAMGVSLETRVPFLDHRVVEFAWQIPLQMKIRDGQSKWLLRQLLQKFVPKELIDRPKTGFGVPIDDWLRGPLREWAEDLLSEDRLKQEGFLHPGPIRKTWQEHLSGKRNWQYHLWNVLMFQAWLEAERCTGI